MLYVSATRIFERVAKRDLTPKEGAEILLEAKEKRERMYRALLWFILAFALIGTLFCKV